MPHSKNTVTYTRFMRRRAHVSLLAFTLLGVAGMFAPPLAAPVFAADTASAEKKQDYEKLAASIKALSSAFKRELRKVGVENTETLNDFELHLKKAEKLAAAGKYDKAYALLNESYHTLAAAIVTLENARNQGVSNKRPDTGVDPKASADEQREFITHEMDTNKALLDALKHQNDDKHGGKESEIAAIKTAAAKAEAALKAGDIARAGTLIHDANSRVKTAIASLQPHPEENVQHQEQSVKPGKDARNSYARRKESVIALLEAGKRIEDTEGGKGASHSEFSIAKDLLKEAEELAAADQFADGKIQLDLAYLLAKDAVRSLRGGEKVRDDKKFATKADEYKYEQTRNDDYQELIVMLIKNKAGQNLEQTLEKARSLRREAETASKSGDFELALRKILESTNELKIVGMPIIWHKL